MQISTVLAEKIESAKILNKEEVEYVCGHFDTEIIKKNQFFLESGSKCSKIGFLESGILCSFIYSSEGDEVVKYFIEENQFFTDLESYENRTPADLNILALVESRVFTISKKQNSKLQSEIPQWEHVLNIFAAEALNKMIQNQNFLHFGTAVEQYQYLLNNHPNLARNVPLKYIASYLGITQSSLSRIRAQQG